MGRAGSTPPPTGRLAHSTVLFALLGLAAAAARHPRPALCGEHPVVPGDRMFPAQPFTTTPLLVVMGVSAVVSRPSPPDPAGTRWDRLEDDLHPPANLASMTSGRLLTERDRRPWRPGVVTAWRCGIATGTGCADRGRTERRVRPPVRWPRPDRRRNGRPSDHLMPAPLRAATSRRSKDPSRTEMSSRFRSNWRPTNRCGYSCGGRSTRANPNRITRKPTGIDILPNPRLVER